MKILAATSSFPSNSSPQAGLFVAQWRDYLMERGHQIDVLRPEGTLGVPTDPSFKTWGPLLKGHGAPEYLDKSGWKGMYGVIAQTTGMYIDYVGLPKSYDLIVGHWLLPWGLFPTNGYPMHLYAHGSDVALLERLPRWLGTMLARRIMKNASGITFVSENLRSRFKVITNTSWRCTHNVQPMGVFRTQPDVTLTKQLKASGRADFTVTALGRLVPIKGIDVLIRAMDSIQGCRLLIAGDGPERSRLERLAQAQSSRVTFLGHVTPSQREALLQQTDLFVQCSRMIEHRQEGCPIALLEALDTGVPAIVSATGGMRELAKTAGLSCVQSNDPFALKAIIEKHVHDRDFHKQQRRLALKQSNQWTWPTMVAQHESILLASCAQNAILPK